MEMIERLVVFAVFMENGGGIVDKAPDYIMEKWALSQARVSGEFIIAGLDRMNQAKFEAWRRIWSKPSEKEARE